MKKIIILFIISYLFQSCIALKFPDKMEINISVPEDYDIEKLEILEGNDSLRSNFLIFSLSKPISSQSQKS